MLSLALLVAATLANAAPLEPNGKWVVDYEPNMCILSRSYGAPPNDINLALWPMPASEFDNLVLITPDGASKGKAVSKAILTTPDGKSVERDFYTWVTKGSRVVMLGADHDDITAIGDGGVLTIDAGRFGHASLRVSGFKAAMNAVGTCKADLGQEWGIAPDEAARVTTPATPVDGIGNWITLDDYPSEALGVHGGMVTVVWAIGTDGRVHDCRTVQSSGHVELDQAACNAITKRGRYKPARDAAGQPMVTHATRRVRWESPVM